MKNKILKLLSISFIIIATTGCTSFVEDENIDPDLLTDTDAKNLFQGVLLANQFFQTSENVRGVMLWMNQANGENRQYVSLNNWNLSTASEFDSSWNTAYVNCITQSKLTQLKALAENNPQLEGAAQVIEAHCMGTVTSLWGDVPYSELDITGNNLQPRYDSQASVYASMQILLDDAIANLNDSGVIPSDKDIYFQGETQKWIELAYSLKARFYLHVKNYPLAKTNALLGISSASGDFKAQFGNSSYQDFNPYYSFLIYDRDDYMSGEGYAYDILDSGNSLYRGNAKTDESARFAFTYIDWSGYGYFSKMLNADGGDWADGTNGKFGSDSNMPMITYGEMLLIVAEVDTRASFATGLPSYNAYRALLNTGYSIGIDDSGYDGNSFSYLPYDVSDFVSITGMENPGSLTDQNALLKEIYQERYVYFLGTYECYTDYGRTNNLAGIQLKTGFSNTPQRLIYPQVEINSNRNTPSPVPSVHIKTPVHL